MRTLAALVFPGFQTLDFFGPIEMFGAFRDRIDISIVAEKPDPVPSVHGHFISVDKTLAESHRYDLILVPGGDAALVDNDAMKAWLAEAAEHAELVMAVCTGTVLLATAGLLDGRRATTNKIDFKATTPLAPNVEWVPRARWVEDGKFFTSSGVSAGMDMSLAAIARLFGEDVADELADGCEYEWHKDPDWDPFAETAGLV